MSALRTYNVEAGLPTLDEARRLVIEEIKRAKRERVKVLKVIHGYGSSGKGGAPLA
jgi:DNA-nicking Smr family endonuclease